MTLAEVEQRKENDRINALAGRKTDLEMIKEHNRLED